MFEQMLKAMGIDPEQIKEMATGIGATVEDIRNRLDTIERQHIEILNLLTDQMPKPDSELIEHEHPNGEFQSN